MKNDVDVIIGGKTYTMSGYESEEYLQKIASFINSKYQEVSKDEGYKHLDNDLRNILMQINLADEYMKKAEENDDLRKQIDDKNKEIFELKHELITRKEEERKRR